MARRGDFHICPACGKKGAFVRFLERFGVNKGWGCRYCEWTHWGPEPEPPKQADAAPRGGRSRGALGGED